MLHFFPSVKVTEAALAQTRTTATSPVTPAPTPTATPAPTLHNAPRSDSGDPDAQRFARYIEQNFPGVLRTRS
jgi:hypothetical protein